MMKVTRICNPTWPETILNIRNMAGDSDLIIRDIPCEITKRIDYAIWVTINNRLNIISKLLLKKLDGEMVEENVEEFIDLYNRSLDRIM